MLNKIITKLKEVKGLNNIHTLTKKDKEYINLNEENNNLGVKECLKREITLVLTHNKNFRKPLEKITINKDKKITFPPIPFPEVKAKNVVSSSPSKKIHIHLIKSHKIIIRDNEATLLIGFNL